jgi:transcription antitermination factor NusA-like protein
VRWVAVLALLLGASARAEEGCEALASQLASQLPQLRKGRVEVAACARLPGVRAVVVLRAPGGADPLVVAGGPDGARLRSVVGSWKAEPLEFVAEGAVEPLLLAAMAPLKPLRVEPWPALRAIDVVLSEADRRAPELASRLTFAEELTGAVIRVYADGVLAAVRADAAAQMVTRLRLTEAQADALVALGCHDLSDLVLAERAAVTAALGGAEAARAVSEAAAWAVELGEPGVRRRGW